MNYVLQIVRGRSEANTLKLIDGVNSIGRHDDCLIRIRSAQVSRRHCEIFEDGGRLMLRDLGSSNGTFVNGKRVLGQQALKSGDVLTIGGVTLRVDPIKPSSTPGAEPEPGLKASDTAELDALPVAEEDDLDAEEFEIAIEEEPVHVDIIPLDDEPPAAPPKKSGKPASSTTTPAGSADTTQSPVEKAKPAEPAHPSGTPEEEDAVAQFLMDLKLDDED